MSGWFALGIHCWPSCGAAPRLGRRSIGAPGCRPLRKRRRRQRSSFVIVCNIGLPVDGTGGTAREDVAARSSSVAAACSLRQPLASTTAG
jgi:hypothetical protein